jgi:arabinofuranosyltransferase
MRERRAAAATLLLWAGLAALLAWRFAGQATDDIYVTYRYAWNLAHGLGFTFNPGERVFGLTDPGVGLLLALAHRLTGLPIPLLGTALSALALFGVAALLLGESREAGRLPEGIAAGTLLLTSAYLWTAQGSGPLFALLLLLVAARLSGREAAARWTAQRAGRSDLAAGLLAGLAFWCRPDAALGIALLGVLLILERRRLPWAWALAASGVMLAGCAAAWAAFGTLLPNTLAAKRAYAAFEPAARMGIAFWRSAWGYWRGYEGPWAAVLLALGLLGLLPLARSGGRAGRLLAGNGLALAVAYTLLRVPFFLWYTLPAAAALLVGAPWAVGWATRALAARSHLLAAAGAVAGGLALASALFASGRWFAAGGAGDWRLAAYSQAGAWIRDHSRPTDDVALEEIGILGYTSQRPVSDLMGLVTPRAVPYAAQGDLIGAFLAQPTEFLVFHTFTWRGGTRPILTRPWFAGAYEAVARFDLPRLGGSITVYRRRPGAKIPPPRPPRAHRQEAQPHR